MAIVKAPALSIAASGNLGAICYTTWRGVAVARDVWTGTVPNTPDQVLIQGYMTTVSQAWSGLLTETERQKWREAAIDEVRMSRIKTQYTPTGYQYFVQLNMQAIRQAFPPITLPPAAMDPFGFGKITIIYQLGLTRFAVNAADLFKAVPTTVQGEYWRAGPYDNAGRHPIDPEFKFIAYTTLQPGLRDATAIALKYYWYRLRWADSSGRVGNWFEGQGYSG